MSEGKVVEEDCIDPSLLHSSTDAGVPVPTVDAPLPLSDGDQILLHALTAWESNLDRDVPATPHTSNDMDEAMWDLCNIDWDSITEEEMQSEKDAHVGY